MAVVYFTVQLVHALTYRNRHGSVRSAIVAEPNISQESKVGSNVLEWCLHLMSEKTIDLKLPCPGLYLEINIAN